MNNGKSKGRAHARERGTITMEMVVICVLIAVACLVGVFAFGRALLRETHVMGEGISGQGVRAGKAISSPGGYRDQLEDDMKDAGKFHKEFSDVEK